MHNWVRCMSKLSDSIDRDEKEAIDESNVIKGDRLRHAKPTSGYREKEEDDLPAAVEETGRSSTR
jgi:hypothetical protein